MDAYDRHEQSNFYIHPQEYFQDQDTDGNILKHLETTVFDYLANPQQCSNKKNAHYSGLSYTHSEEPRSYNICLCDIGFIHAGRVAFCECEKEIEDKIWQLQYEDANVDTFSVSLIVKPQPALNTAPAISELEGLVLNIVQFRWFRRNIISVLFWSRWKVVGWVDWLLRLIINACCLRIVGVACWRRKVVVGI